MCDVMGRILIIFFAMLSCVLENSSVCSASQRNMFIDVFSFNIQLFLIEIIFLIWVKIFSWPLCWV